MHIRAGSRIIRNVKYLGVENLCFPSSVATFRPRQSRRRILRLIMTGSHGFIDGDQYGIDILSKTRERKPLAEVIALNAVLRHVSAMELE